MFSCSPNRNIYTGLSPSELHLHRSCFKPGQVCCALFTGMWHRAQILEVPDVNKVKVSTPNLFLIPIGGQN